MLPHFYKNTVEPDLVSDVECNAIAKGENMRKYKILFAYIPDYLFINNEKTPYGLFCLKDVLEKDGRFVVEIKDYNLVLFNRKWNNTSSKMVDTFNLIAQELSESGADAISFYTMCSNFYCCVPVAKRFKELCPTVPIVFAGPHATCVAQNILEYYSFVDYVAMGEGEKSVIPIFDAIFLSHDFSGINGIAFRKENAIKIQWDRKDRILGSELPQIDLGELIAIDPDLFLTLEGGRGCPFSCTFCSTQKFWGNVFAVKPVDMLISEMQHYNNKYGVSKFSISHDLFTANRKYILEFCKKVCSLPFKIEWGCSSRLDVLDNELIAAMIQSGCTDIYIGVESGSPRIQRLISKNLDIDHLGEKLTLLLQGRITCILSFIYGYPFEEEEDIELTLRKIYDAKKIESNTACASLVIQFHRLTFLPGTAIADECYDELKFEGINTMSYFNEDVEIPSAILDMMLQNKMGFLNCYNLPQNMNKFYNHLGDFVCLWFNLFYIHYKETIDLVLQYFSTLISFFKFVYEVDALFFLETARFSGIYFGDDRDELLCSAFVDFVENHFSPCEKIIATLKREQRLAERESM